MTSSLGRFIGPAIIASVFSAVPAHASEQATLTDEPWVGVTLTLGSFSPQIGDGALRSAYDSSFASTGAPFFVLTLTRYLQNLTRSSIGVFGVEVGGGVWAVGTSTGSLRVVPLRAGLAYRFDLLRRHTSIPVLLYARAAFDGWIWASGDGFAVPVDVGTATGGVSTGIDFAGGIALDLTAIDERSRRRFASASIVLEFSQSWIDDFGINGGAALDLTSTRVSVGLALDF